MSHIDRLAELRGAAPSGDSNPFADESPKTEETGNPEIAGHMQLYEPIKTGLEQIQKNVSRIEKLKVKSRTIAKEKDIKEIMRQLDGIMSETTGKGGKIKAALDNIKRLNEQHKQGNKGQTAITQMRINLYQTHIRRFHSIMNEYNAAAHDFKQNLQDRTRRQLQIVDSDITEEEIEKIVSSGQADGVIKEVLINDNMKTVVREIEERHLDILKLEKQVMEVYELFRDLATLVDIQQESLDVIENRIVHAQEYAAKGEVELRKAEKESKKSRRRTCCLIIILLVILVVLALSIGLSFS